MNIQPKYKVIPTFSCCIKKREGGGEERKYQGY